MAHRPTVRGRLTVAVAIAVTLSSAVIGVTLYLVESRRIERAIDAGLSQELGEFRALQSENDPTTNKPFASGSRVMTVFLQRNLPDEHEALYAFGPTGGPLYQGAGDPRLQKSQAFRDAVDELRSSGGTTTVDAGGQEYRIVVQPVTDSTGASAFVVAHNVSASRQALRELIVTYTLLAAITIIAIAALASSVIARLLAPLLSLQSTARDISGGDLTTRTPVTGHDDVSDLQIAFNDMLDRVEAAFTAQRQLLDDAGHELRTPLTILQGHLEVLDPADTQDVEQTRALLLDEIARMSGLVDDLLMLAKARRPDFVKFAETDVEALTMSILDRARGLGDRAWILDGVTRSSAILDPQRMTQAVLQLCQNSVKHTQPGDEIAVGSRVHDGSIELWVRDAGAGVDPTIRDTLFDRFARSGSDDEGFGLGLSIVRAIAVAHGGSVTLDDLVAGVAKGATFRITIPLTGGGNSSVSELQ